ncbi:MAG: MerR family transcriptional regulator [Eubacteriales bacterium]|nr:MerR family transcriptional regulator [Eubacteriales bacterium]
MRIGEIAKLTGLNISNIRFYERKGLLCPNREDDSKYRDYTEEDVLRVKEILLYRKMGISIETIYLLISGQANQKDVLLRQQNILQDEIRNLKGAAELCQMLLRDGGMEVTGDQIDQYLDYVYQEEEKGGRFAEVEELLADITEYTREEVFYWSPIRVWLYKRSWTSVVFPLFFWGLIIMVPISHLIDVFLKRTSLSIPLLCMYGSILVMYYLGFRKFRKSKRRYFHRSFVEKDGEEE